MVNANYFSILTRFYCKIKDSYKKFYRDSNLYNKKISKHNRCRRWDSVRPVGTLWGHVDPRGATAFQMSHGLPKAHRQKEERNQSGLVAQSVERSWGIQTGSDSDQEFA